MHLTSLLLYENGILGLIKKKPLQVNLGHLFRGNICRIFYLGSFIIKLIAIFNTSSDSKKSRISLWKLISSWLSHWFRQNFLIKLKLSNFDKINGGWMKSSPQYHHKRKIRITSQKYLKSEQHHKINITWVLWCYIVTEDLWWYNITK